MGSRDANKLGPYDDPCGACKCLCRRCTEDCVYAPYFPSECPEKFNNVVDYLGETSFAKLMDEVDVNKRQRVIDLADQAFTLRQLSKPFQQALEYVDEAVEKELFRPADEQQITSDSADIVCVMRQLFRQVEQALEYAEKVKLCASNDLEHIHAEHVSTLREMLGEIQEALQCVEKDNERILKNPELVQQLHNICVNTVNQIRPNHGQSSVVVASSTEEDRNLTVQVKKELGE